MSVRTTFSGSFQLDGSRRSGCSCCDCPAIHAGGPGQVGTAEFFLSRGLAASSDWVPEGSLAPPPPGRCSTCGCIGSVARAAGVEGWARDRPVEREHEPPLRVQATWARSELPSEEPPQLRTRTTWSHAAHAMGDVASGEPRGTLPLRTTWRPQVPTEPDAEGTTSGGGHRGPGQRVGGMLGFDAGGGSRSFAASRGASLAVDTLEGGTEIVDVHSHFFAGSIADWGRWRSHPTPSQMEQRIRWLRDDVGGAGVTQMVLSGHYDSTAQLYFMDRLVGAPGYESELDDVVEEVAATDPSFFVPFTRGFALTDADPAGYVAGRLADGFRGVGEVFVHAYGTASDFGDAVVSDKVRAVCEEAGAYGVPITMHWNIGYVDSAATYTAEENFDQLTALLDSLEADGIEVNIILAHCGIGPYKYDSSSTSEPDSDAWATRIETLLSDYPNVYFDLAGMQVDSDHEQEVHQLMDDDDHATPVVGTQLLAWLAASSSRFLLGVDARTQFAEETEDPDDPGSYLPGIASFAASVSAYDTFLEQVAWPGPFAEYRVRSGNARRLL